MVEQVIRPTGLLDPVIKVQPSEHQIDHLLEQIELRREKGERVLVTTLTKRMAEELNDYLQKLQIKSAYIHSDVDTLDRIKILDNLRAGVFDVLIGVNLLREGLDLPEVSLVAIIDADKEGFLRSHRSLTQTVGRAARNLNGMVIMYADKITDSMRLTIEETERRRAKQLAYNEEHGITPQAIVKARNRIIGMDTDDLPETRSAANSSGRKSQRTASPLPYENEYTSSVDIAADPVIPYMSAAEMQRSITRMRSDMVAAAKNMEFMEAARLRDEILKMEELLKKSNEAARFEKYKHSCLFTALNADRLAAYFGQRDEAPWMGRGGCSDFFGDAYVDHPSFGAAVIGRTLVEQGDTVWLSCHNPTGRTICVIFGNSGVRVCFSGCRLGRWILWSIITPQPGVAAATMPIPPTGGTECGLTTPLWFIPTSFASFILMSR